MNSKKALRISQVLSFIPNPVFTPILYDCFVTRHSKRYLSKAARKTTLYIIVSGLAMIILFPIFFLVSLSLMSNYEAYSEWPNPLVPKFSSRFKIERLQEGVTFRLTQASLEDLQQAGVPETVTEQLVVFVYTRIVLGELKRAGLPDELLNALLVLEKQQFRRKDDFLQAVTEQIGAEQTARHQELLLEACRDFASSFKKNFPDKTTFLTTLQEYIGQEHMLHYQDVILNYAEARYRISIYNNADQAYQQFGPETFSLKTEELDKLTEFFTRQANCTITRERLQSEIAQLAKQDVGYFSLRKRLLANYIVFFQVTRDSGPAVLRSLYTAFSTITISLTIGGMAGFAFARFRFKGKNWLKLSVLFVRMFPGVAIAIPMVIILGNLGLYDKPIGLSLAYSITQIALTIWITASIFLGIPVELEEAALIFGTTRFGAFWHVTFPLALPGLAACAMYAFIGAWNEAAQAIILTQFNPTFPVVIYEVLAVSNARGLVNLVTAGSVAQALPAVIFTLFIRKYIVHMWGGVRV